MPQGYGVWPLIYSDFQPEPTHAGLLRRYHVSLDHGPSVTSQRRSNHLAVSQFKDDQGGMAPGGGGGGGKISARLRTPPTRLLGRSPGFEEPFRPFDAPVIG